MSKESFIDQILFLDLACNSLVVGKDAAVGHKGSGDVDFMKRYFEKNSRKLIVEDFVNFQGKKVSSSLLRDDIKSADFEKASTLLNRKFSIKGRVVKGYGNGKKLSFPTANINYKNKLLPKIGVYAGYALLNNVRYDAVCNIGVRPTFSGSNLSLEVHIIGRELEDFYGELLSFEFFRYLRGEKKFNSLDELKNQIHLDVESAKKIL